MASFIHLKEFIPPKDEDDENEISPQDFIPGIEVFTELGCFINEDWEKPRGWEDGREVCPMDRVIVNYKDLSHCDWLILTILDGLEIDHTSQLHNLVSLQKHSLLTSRVDQESEDGTKSAKQYVSFFGINRAHDAIMSVGTYFLHLKMFKLEHSNSTWCLLHSLRDARLAYSVIGRSYDDDKTGTTSQLKKFSGRDDDYLKWKMETVGTLSQHGLLEVINDWPYALTHPKKSAVVFGLLRVAFSELTGPTGTFLLMHRNEYGSNKKDPTDKLQDKRCGHEAWKAITEKYESKEMLNLYVKQIDEDLDNLKFHKSMHITVINLKFQSLYLAMANYEKLIKFRSQSINHYGWFDLGQKDWVLRYVAKLKNTLYHEIANGESQKQTDHKADLVKCMEATKFQFLKKSGTKRTKRRSMTPGSSASEDSEEEHPPKKKTPKGNNPSASNFRSSLKNAASQKMDKAADFTETEKKKFLSIFSDEKGSRHKGKNQSDKKTRFKRRKSDQNDRDKNHKNERKSADSAVRRVENENSDPGEPDADIYTVDEDIENDFSV